MAALYAGWLESLKLRVLLVVHGLEPFVTGALARDLDRHVREPAVPGRTVPVLYPCGDVHDVAGMQPPGLLPPRLVPSPAAGAEEDLSPAGLGVMDVPVVPASGSNVTLAVNTPSLVRMLR